MQFEPLSDTLIIYQGADWKPILWRWLSEDLRHQAITSIAAGLPTLLTVTGHGLPVGERVPLWISDATPAVLNTTGFETDDAPRWAEVIDANTLSIDFDTSGQTANGGIISTRDGVDLSGATGQMEVRASLDDATQLLLLTTANGGLILGADGSIQSLVIKAAVEAFAWRKGVYILDITLASGDTLRFALGPIAVSRNFPP